MGYVCKEYYLEVFGGKYDGDGLDGFIERAGVLIDALTHGRARDFDGLTKFQQDGVRRACCLMVDYFAGVDGEPSGDISSYSAGNMRVWTRQRKHRPWEVLGCGMWAYLELMKTGLMRGVI